MHSVKTARELRGSLGNVKALKTTHWNSFTAQPTLAWKLLGDRFIQADQSISLPGETPGFKAVIF